MARYIGTDVTDVTWIEKMEEQEAGLLLEQHLLRAELLGDIETRKELLNELDNLPLAITQAAAYMTVNGYSVQEYLELLRSTEQDIAEILSEEMGDSTRYRQAANAVAKTWQVSFKQILEQDSIAAKLLEYMSCIEWKAIPYSILPEVQSRVRTASAIGTLYAYSFIDKRHEKKQYDMHHLVYLAVRIWVKQHGSPAEVRQRAMLHLANVFPWDDYANLKVWRECLPHVSRINDDTGGESMEGKRLLCEKVGRCLRVDGRIKEAVVWLEESCRCVGDLAKDDPSKIASQHVLAGAYRANGQVKKANELLEHVVKTREALLVEDHPNRLASQRELAKAYQANGRFKEAVELLEHVLKIKGAVLRKDPSRLVSHNEHAMADQGSVRAKEVVRAILHIVSTHEAVLVEDHLD